MNKHTKEFSTATVASVLTGIALGDFGDTIRLLSHLTGTTVFTDEAPHMGRATRCFLFDQVPHMRDVRLLAEAWDISNPTIAARFVDYLEELHGETQVIRALPVPIQEYIQSSFLYAHEGK